jgi:hypothetical protein
MAGAEQQETLPKSSSQQTVANGEPESSSSAGYMVALKAGASRLREVGSHVSSQARPWDEIFDRSAYDRPSSLGEASSRVRKNANHFKARAHFPSSTSSTLPTSPSDNKSFPPLLPVGELPHVHGCNPWPVYAPPPCQPRLAARCASSLPSPHHRYHYHATLTPFSRTAALLFGWIYVFLLRTEPIVINGRQLSEREKVWAISGITLLVVMITNIGTVLFSAIGLALTGIAIHGSLRVPDDLFLVCPSPIPPACVARTLPSLCSKMISFLFLFGCAGGK